MPPLLTGESRLSEALALDPAVLEYIVSLNPHDFTRLRNPLMRKLMPPRITLQRVARMTEASLGEMLLRVHEIAGVPLTELDRDRFTEQTLGDADSEQPRPHWTFANPIVVDLLPADERLDADPMLAINRALNTHPTGTLIMIKHKWEPQPLYDVWDRIGVEHFAQQKTENEWRIYVRKTCSKAERKRMNTVPPVGGKEIV